MEGKIKFLYIFICFCISLISLKKPLSKKDSRLLTASMLFTLVSDFMLIILYQNTLGVFTFCFAHIMYICRNKLALKANNSINLKVYLICSVLIFLISRVLFDALISISAFYTCLFVLNLYLSYEVFKSGEHPKINRRLIFAGTILFALCDINVLLFNLQFYINNRIIAETISPTALILAWVFYAPSQAVLALSGINYQKKEDVFNVL